MILGIAEDGTSDVALDAQLTAVPDSGLYLNTGGPPSITLSNLLDFLPNLSVTITAFSAGTTYTKYETSRKRTDLVTDGGITYESLVDSNTGNTPASSPTQWLVTNLDSLRIKNFIFSVKEKVYADLRLSRRLINNQYLYEIGDTTVTLPNDFAAWVFEPKGSDYVRFTLNQVSLQKAGTTPVNLYVVNQGVLVTTLTATPANGIVQFNTLDYSFSGFGKWIFAIDSTDVVTSSGGIDPQKYDGFLAYTASGIGATPEGAAYTFGTTSNGLGFNVTTRLDSSTYIDNNVNDLATYVRATFTYMVFQMFLHNANNRSNRAERIQMADQLLIAELKEANPTVESVVGIYKREKEAAKTKIEKTFDTQLFEDDDLLEIRVTSI